MTRSHETISREQNAVQIGKDAERAMTTAIVVVGLFIVAVVVGAAWLLWWIL